MASPDPASGINVNLNMSPQTLAAINKLANALNNPTPRTPRANPANPALPRFRHPPFLGRRGAGVQFHNPLNRQAGISLPFLGRIATATGAMAIGIGVAGELLKTVVSNSRIANTYLSTMGKIFGAAIDVLLAPFTPLLNLMLVAEMKLLQWLISHEKQIEDAAKVLQDAIQHPERVPGDLVRAYRDSFGGNAARMFRQDIGDPFQHFVQHPSVASGANLLGGAAKYIGISSLGDLLQHPSIGNLVGAPFKAIADVFDLPSQILRNFGVPVPRLASGALSGAGDLLSKIPGMKTIAGFNPFSIFGGGGGQKPQQQQTPAQPTTQTQQQQTQVQPTTQPNQQTIYAPSVNVNVTVTPPPGADARTHGTTVGQAAADQLGSALGIRSSAAAYG